MKNLIIVTLLILASGLSYGQSREQEQTLIHGAGGCTPNFSTGGCL